MMIMRRVGSQERLSNAKVESLSVSQMKTEAGLEVEITQWYSRVKFCCAAVQARVKSGESRHCRDRDAVVKPSIFADVVRIVNAECWPWTQTSRDQ